MKRTVILHFMHKFENEIYNEEQARQRVMELVSDGYPIRASILDTESNTLCITFGCKGAILVNDEV